MKILSNCSLNLIQRTISGIFIAVIFIGSIFFARSFFVVLMMLISGFMLSEWYNMTYARKKYLFLGLIIIPIPIISLLYISLIDFTGWLLFAFFVTIWSVDVFAMFAGKMIGGLKLAKTLSPKKTISGFCTAILIAAILPILFSIFTFYDIILAYFGGSHLILSTNFVIIAAIAQISDLFISYFKRKFKIKDSGNIIPGHGGVLDRFDSIILTTPIIALYLFYQL